MVVGSQHSVVIKLLVCGGSVRSRFALTEYAPLYLALVRFQSVEVLILCLCALCVAFGCPKRFTGIGERLLLYPTMSPYSHTPLSHKLLGWLRPVNALTLWGLW